jgi:hypothetical protein
MDHITERSILKMIEECKNELNIDKEIEILYKINSMLPTSEQLKIPSLIANDYVSHALYTIEEKLLVAR